MNNIQTIDRSEGGRRILEFLNDGQWDERLINLGQEISTELIGAPNWKVVHVSGNNKDYWRRAPGAKEVGPAFEAVATLVSVSLQAFEDSKRTDLTGSQRLGRASLAVMPGVSLIIGISSVVAPEKTDKFTADFFSSKNPVVDKLADVIVKIGGKKFQEWSVKPHWLDFF